VDLIVDGYNVILSDSTLSKLLRNNVAAARDELIHRIRLCRRLARVKIEIIFDGKFRSPVELLSDKFIVKFSVEGETADDLIKEEIGKYNSRKSLCVVTNDQAIIRYAQICGANTMRSSEFLSFIRGTVPASKEIRVRGKTTKRTSDETDIEKPSLTVDDDKELLKLFKGQK
jgi:predicted RNA-binding protein with PIN domain